MLYYVVCIDLCMLCYCCRMAGWFIIYLLQTIITQVNHAIGAKGIVSQECKAVVSQYGEEIINMLLAKVSAKLSLRHYKKWLII